MVDAKLLGAGVRKWLLLLVLAAVCGAGLLLWRLGCFLPRWIVWQEAEDVHQNDGDDAQHDDRHGGAQIHGAVGALQILNVNSMKRQTAAKSGAGTTKHSAFRLGT